MAVVKFFLRSVLVAGILAYFVAAAGLLATRYWLLPRIDQWRPEIQQAISQAVGTPVRFDSITADWRGLNANLKITNLTILDEEGVAQLGVPTTDVIVSWRSLLSLEPIFRYIGFDDVILVARRSPEGQMYVAGFDIASDDHDQTGFWQSPTMRWLLKQGRVNIENSRLVWVDQQRNAVPLVLEDIDITIDNGLLGHKLALKITLPSHLGGNLEMVADIDALHSSFSKFLLDEPDGYIYADISELYPQALHPWLDLPQIEGSLAARLWLDVLDGKFTNFTASLAGRDTTYSPSEAGKDRFTLGEFRWQASGPLGFLGADVEFPGIVEPSNARQRLSSSFSLAQGSFQSPMPGMQPIVADQVSADLSVSKPTGDGLRVDIRDMAFANPDGLVTARGSWTLDVQGKGGRLDIQGTLARFKLPNLHHYLPDTIGADAKTWLTTAFKSGLVPQASFEVSGLADDFPFSTEGTGTFRIDGTVRDWAIDYSPPESPDELPWPPLADLNGTLTMLNDRIAVDIASGALSLPKGERIILSAISAELADLDGDALLTVKGQTNAEASNYLALFQGTALRDIAPEFVRDFSGEGSWSMPLTLRVPLDDVENTSFRGELAFNGGTVGYLTSPRITDLTGIAKLSEKGFESEGLSGKFLGGNVTIAGGIDDTLDTVKASGEIAWTEIAKQTGSDLVGQWFTGQLPFELTATVKDETFDVVLDSDLRRTKINLPAPLGLSSDGTAKAVLRWQGYVKGDNAENWSLSIANRLSVIGTASTRSDAKASSFFNRIGVAIGSAAKPLLDSGFTVVADVPTIALDDWMPTIDMLDRELQGSAAKGPRLMPGLTRATLKTKQFVMGSNRLEDVLVDMTVRNGRQYTAEVSSAQTKGSIQWAMDQGKLQDGYVVRLDKLEIGNHDNGEKPKAKQASQDGSALPEPGALSNLPALDVEIKDLTLYGSRLGEFKISGRNTVNQQQWQISNLQIINPNATLTASGSCRFNANPGVTLDAELQITDLGELIKFMGQGERVRKGRGTLKANLEWARFPWQFDYAGMSGKAELSLEEGVFDHINSSSARVLELLSMQSLNRILDANINPEESFEQGFPWNSIAGTFDINKGVVDTQNLAINSPVATISLTGHSSLVKETWDLEAVVRPNLDMSGTALATGFLVNPIVGLSALVGQYLLRNPVESALSQRYHVTGSWDDPKINEGPKPNGSTKNQAEQQSRQPEVRN